MKKKVLVFDDENEIYEAAKHELEDNSTDVIHSRFIEDAVRKLNCNHFSLVILNVLLSDSDAHSIIAAIRKAKPMPILVLSEDTNAADRIKALENGADDCINKDDDYEECFVRAKTMLKRYTELNHLSQHNYAVVAHDSLVLDARNHEVSIDGAEVNLSPKGNRQIQACL